MVNYKRQPLIYIAGALNSDACGYIINLHDMTQMELYVKDKGFSTCNPGNDFITGLVSGRMSYEDYIQNSLDLMVRCDGIMLCKNWKSSKGVEGELEIAHNYKIPVFEVIDDLQDFFWGKKTYD